MERWSLSSNPTCINKLSLSVETAYLCSRKRIKTINSFCSRLGPTRRELNLFAVKLVLPWNFEAPFRKRRTLPGLFGFKFGWCGTVFWVVRANRDHITILNITSDIWCVLSFQVLVWGFNIWNVDRFPVTRPALTSFRYLWKLRICALGSALKRLTVSAADWGRREGS